MITRSNVKLGLTGALLSIVFGSLVACSELPTEANDDSEKANRCIRIDHIIHCPPT
jgi:hypothetical protein